MLTRKLAAVLLAALCVACATADNISGRWQLLRTDGGSHSVKWTQLDRHIYYLHGELLDIAGKYRRDGDVFTLVSADNPRMQPVQIRLNPDHSMTVVEAPSLSRAEMNFLAAKLVSVRQ